MACGRFPFLGISMALLAQLPWQLTTLWEMTRAGLLIKTRHSGAGAKFSTLGTSSSLGELHRDKGVFKYDSSKHNVFKVNGSFFQNCTIPSENPLHTGNDVIPLTSTGRKWYICGFGDHCSVHNMKLVIDVVSDGPAGAPSPGISAARAVVWPFYGVFTAAIVAIAAIFF